VTLAPIAKLKNLAEFSGHAFRRRFRPLKNGRSFSPKNSPKDPPQNSFTPIPRKDFPNRDVIILVEG